MQRDVVAPMPPPPLENPLFVPQGPEGYRQVYQQAYTAVAHYFPVTRSNFYAGTMETLPVITAGFWDGPKLNWYSFSELYESALQTIRRRVLVTITPAEVGGYFVDIQVYKELEDLPRPLHANAGAATYRFEVPIERIGDVVDVPYVTKGWIPLGRDHALEQRILARFRDGK